MARFERGVSRFIRPTNVTSKRGKSWRLEQFKSLVCFRLIISFSLLKDTTFCCKSFLPLLLLTTSYFSPQEEPLKAQLFSSKTIFQFIKECFVTCSPAWLSLTDHCTRSSAAGQIASPFFHRESLFCNDLVIEKFSFNVACRCCFGVFNLQLTLIHLNLYCCSLNYTKRKGLKSVSIMCL